MQESKLSSKELKELLAKREKEEKKVQRAKEAAYEKEKNDFIQASIVRIIDAAATLKELKTDLIERGTALHSQMYKIYDKEEKDQNSFSIDSKDGKYRLNIEKQDRQKFNEKAEVWIHQIRDILKSKFEGRNKGAYELLDSVLMKNNKGDYDEKLVAKLNKHKEKVNSEEFNEALDELAKCYETYESAIYVRAYKMNEQTQKWENINLQFSSL